MNGVTLTLKSETQTPIDCRSLLPENLCSLGGEEIAGLSMNDGTNSGRVVGTVGDLFNIEISEGEYFLRIKNANASLAYVGAGMTEGRLIIDGDVGDYLGFDLLDGELIANGNAGNFAGSGQANGLIHIKGSVGHYAGGASDTKMQGLKGGTLMISGTSGDFLGYKMRRGIIIAQDQVGDHTANNMIAGTIILGSHCGSNLALGMRRGTVLFLDKTKLNLPSFNLCGSFALPILTVLRHHVHNINHHIAIRLSKIQKVQRFCGDLGYDGQGEVLIAD